MDKAAQKTYLFDATLDETIVHIARHGMRFLRSAVSRMALEIQEGDDDYVDLTVGDLEHVIDQVLDAIDAMDPSPELMRLINATVMKNGRYATEYAESVLCYIRRLERDNARLKARIDHAIDGGVSSGTVDALRGEA